MLTEAGPTSCSPSKQHAHPVAGAGVADLFAAQVRRRPEEPGVDDLTYRSGPPVEPPATG